MSGRGRPVQAILFDFDGVIVDSEIVSSRIISAALTHAGCPTSPAEAIAQFTGLSRVDTLARIAALWGKAMPADMDRLLDEASERHMRVEAVPAVPGAVDFITGPAAHLPKAIGSSSGPDWLARHLESTGLSAAFGRHVYSGRVHVARGKPYPDIYLHAAAALGVAAHDAVVIEDSPVGARAALASGARVIGLAAASHSHAGISEALRAEGVEIVLGSYAAVRAHLGI